MAQKQDISFANPTALIAPDLSSQQAALDRQRQLADALRSESLQQIDPGRGAISWTQGLAKLAQALASRSLYKKADAQQTGLNQAYAQALMQRMGGGVPAPGPSGSPAPGAEGAASPPTQVAPSGPSQVSTSLPQPQGNSPWSLTGDPNQDYAMMALNPDEYGKAVIASHAPTDFTKLLMQAGVDANSPLGRQFIQSQVAKQNYVQPVNGRPGSTLRDPFDPSKVVGYDAPTVEGGIPVYAQDGTFQGYRPAPGAQGIMGGMEGAKAGAKAAAEAPYGVIQVFNPQTGQMEFTTKSAVTGGPRGPGGPGPITQGLSGLPAAPPLGAPAAANTYGTASAKAFGDIQQAGQDTPSRMQALREMGGLLDQGLSTGPAQQKMRDLATHLGIPGIITDNVAEFNKWASQYAARSAGELGLSGSDSRVDLTVHATPNGGMPTGAARTVISQLYGIEAAKAARASMASQWARLNPQDIGGFEKAWRQNYDPKMFEVMQWTPNAREQWLKQHPAEAKNFATRYDALKSMGAF